VRIWPIRLPPRLRGAALAEDDAGVGDAGVGDAGVDDAGVDDAGVVGGAAPLGEGGEKVGAGSVMALLPFS
jgi:hypothetical protein